MAQIYNVILNWTDFPKNSVAAFQHLQVDDALADVTLCCEDQRIRCHKLVLSIGSMYFEEIFRQCTSEQHPVVSLHNVNFVDLQALVTFMYQGKVNVDSDTLKLENLFKTAEFLQVKGLFDDTEEGMKENVAKKTGNVGYAKNTETKMGRRGRTTWTRCPKKGLQSDALLSESFRPPLDLSQEERIDDLQGVISKEEEPECQGREEDDEEEMPKRIPMQLLHVGCSNILTEGGRFICVLCGNKSFKNKNVLYNHRSVYHRNDPNLELGSTETIRDVRNEDTVPSC